MKRFLKHNIGDYVCIDSHYYRVYHRTKEYVWAVMSGYRPMNIMYNGNCSIPDVPIGSDGFGGLTLIPSTWRLPPDSRRIMF